MLETYGRRCVSTACINTECTVHTLGVQIGVRMIHQKRIVCSHSATYPPTQPYRPSIYLFTFCSPRCVLNPIHPHHINCTQPVCYCLTSHPSVHTPNVYPIHLLFACVVLGLRMHARLEVWYINILDSLIVVVTPT